MTCRAVASPLTSASPRPRHRVHHQAVALAAHRVGREQHAGRIGGHHALHDAGHVGRPLQPSAPPVPRARADHSDAQQARTASSTSAAPRTPSRVSCCPAKLDPAASSSTADDRTATRLPASAARRRGNGGRHHGRQRAPRGSPRAGVGPAALSSPAARAVHVSAVGAAGHAEAAAARANPAASSAPRLAALPPTRARRPASEGSTAGRPGGPCARDYNSAAPPRCPRAAGVRLARASGGPALVAGLGAVAPFFFGRRRCAKRWSRWSHRPPPCCSWPRWLFGPGPPTSLRPSRWAAGRRRSAAPVRAVWLCRTAWGWAVAILLFLLPGRGPTGRCARPAPRPRSARSSGTSPGATCNQHYEGALPPPGRRALRSLQRAPATQRRAAGGAAGAHGRQPAGRPPAERGALRRVRLPARADRRPAPRALGGAGHVRDRAGAGPRLPSHHRHRAAGRGAGLPGPGHPAGARRAAEPALGGAGPVRARHGAAGPARRAAPGAGLDVVDALALPSALGGRPGGGGRGRAGGLAVHLGAQRVLRLGQATFTTTRPTRCTACRDIRTGRRRARTSATRWTAWATRSRSRASSTAARWRTCAGRRTSSSAPCGATSPVSWASCRATWPAR